MQISSDLISQLKLLPAARYRHTNEKEGNFKTNDDLSGRFDKKKIPKMCRVKRFSRRHNDLNCKPCILSLLEICDTCI